MADAVVVTKVIEVDVKASANASAQMQQIAASLGGVQTAAEKSSGSLSQMISWVKGFAGFQIFQLVGEHVLAFASALQQASDNAKVLEQRMVLVTKSQEGAKEGFQSIVDIAVRQGREMEGVAKLYEKVTRSSEQLGVTQKGVALITEGVAASLRLSGANIQEANAAMIQFSQALASGKLGGDEFRSMMENDTVLMKAFADALHTTLGGLREMSKEGKLGPETMRKAMLEMGDDGKNAMMRMIEQAAKLPMTFSQATSGVKAALTDLINAQQQFGDKTEGIFTKMVKSVTASMREYATNLRDNAEIRAAVAKALGKDVLPTDLPAVSAGDKRIADLTAKQKELRDIIAHPPAPVYDFKRNIYPPELQVNMKKIEAQLTAVDSLLARALWKKVGEYSIYPGDDLTNGPAQGGTPAKAPKTAHEETQLEFMTKFTAGLNKENIKLMEEVAGTSKALSEFDATMADLDKKPMPKGESAAVAQLKLDAEALVIANDKLKDALTAWKKEKADIVDQFKQDQADTNKHIGERDAEVKKRVDAYNKERLDKDPFGFVDNERTIVDKLLADPDVNNEAKEALRNYMKFISEKATKQLLGEQAHIKNTAELMSDSWNNAFAKMEDDLLDFSKSAKQIVGDFVIAILKDFAKIQIKEQLAPLMKMGSDFVTSLFADNSPLPSPVMESTMSARFGHAFGPGGLVSFGYGGVVNQPTNFAFGGGRSTGQMGEAGTEAVMPLARDRSGRLGVGTVPVNVIVNNNGSRTKATTEERTNANGHRDVVVSIEDIVEGGMGSGRYDAVMGKSFGLGRKGN